MKEEGFPTPVYHYCVINFFFLFHNFALFALLTYLLLEIRLLHFAMRNLSSVIYHLMGRYMISKYYITTSSHTYFQIYSVCRNFIVWITRKTFLTRLCVNIFGLSVSFLRNHWLKTIKQKDTWENETKFAIRYYIYTIEDKNFSHSQNGNVSVKINSRATVMILIRIKTVKQLKIYLFSFFA